MKRVSSYVLAAAWILMGMCGNAHAALQPVPEPGTWLLMGTGVAGLAVYRFIKKSKK